MTLIDESLSWGKVEIPYTTEFADHVMSFHCREVDAAGNWAVPYSTESTVAQTVNKLLDTLHLTIPTGTTFSTFKVYKNNPAPTPRELWWIGDVGTITNAPAASSDASGQVTLSFRTSLNRIAKFVICDTLGSSYPPLRVLPTAFDSAQDSWFDYIEANTNIVTIDGENISNRHSITVNLNDVLVRRYGMQVNTVS